MSTGDSSNKDKFDIILFGATGYTGKNTIPQLLKLCSEENAPNGRALTWAVAGRSEDKLRGVLAEMGKRTGKDLSKVVTVIADVTDEESLTKMAQRARIVVNTCGPYRFYGEAVVRACVTEGTHHVDVSGEPQYMERMQLEYGEKAREKGVYIISACGFDSIPSDMGIVFMENNFEGTLNSVETYLSAWTTGGPYPGASVNYGTWESAVYGLAHADELRGLRTKLFPNRLPSFKPKMKKRAIMHKSSLVRNAWCAPFPGSDRSVVMRSQRHFYEKEGKRPIQMAAYVAIGSIVNMMVLAVLGGIFALLARFSFGRKLLLDHPKFFSFGAFSKEGPTEECVSNTNFSFTFNCYGWDKKLDDANQEFPDKPNKHIVGKFTGTNPGYGATCITLVVSAIMILTESDKMPDKGGVFPPGAAFAKTSMIEQLQKNDLKFEILKTEDV